MKPIKDVIEKIMSVAPPMEPKKTVRNEQVLKAYAEWIEEEAQIGYMLGTLIMATLPHSRPPKNEFTRTNGHFTLSLWANPVLGLPYGALARLIMIWMTSEAKKTKSRIIYPGDSLSEFMRTLDIVPTGGRWGSITRLKNMLDKVFACHFSIVRKNAGTNLHEQINMIPVDDVTETALLWDPVNIGQKSLFKPKVVLSERFYQEIEKHAVPLNMTTLNFLRKSSMAIDIYQWATWRNFYIQKSAKIPWKLLQLQFGAGYPNTSQGLVDFKINFKKSLVKVALVYPAVNKFSMDSKFLVFKPGHPDIPILK